MFNDVSERRRSEVQRAVQHNLLRTLIDHLPDSIYVKDIEGRFQLNNRANLRVLGLTTEGDAHGRTVFDFFPDEYAHLYDQDDKAVLKTLQPIVDREEPYRNQQGEACFYSTTKAPLFDSDGIVVG